jgi:uncharacterized protein
MKALHPHSPWRIFAVSGLITIGSLVGVLLGKGVEALLVATVLIAVEVAFSFDNAIVNAKILNHMSRFWQMLFLTVGALVAIFGMRLVFPILMVALTADLSWGKVLDLALHHPEEYTHYLELAHPALAAFGGSFLLVLALDFFVDPSREVTWLTTVEKSFQKLARNWAPPLITLAVVMLVSVMPFNHHGMQTFVAGFLGVVIYSVIHGLTEMFGRLQRRKVRGTTYVGMAAFLSLLYLEVLDATFSFDSVLGAFVVTQDVILIALGLGVGAFWVRSLTIFMVRRGTLESYKYIEHGAHYTIGILGLIFLFSLFVHVPEVITGLAGIGIIGASIVASRQAVKKVKLPSLHD